MFLKAIVGFALVVGFVAVGAWIVRQRSVARTPWRQVAGSVDRTVGIVAVAFIALLTVGLLRLAL